MIKVMICKKTPYSEKSFGKYEPTNPFSILFEVTNLNRTKYEKFKNQ